MRDLFGIHVFKSMILNTFVYLFQREKKINKKVKYEKNESIKKMLTLRLCLFRLV